MFTTNLYDVLAEDNGNIFFSPFSIKVALGMLQAGASGETKEILVKTLATPGFKREIADVNTTHPDYELVTANALWGQQGDIKDSFKKTILKDYAGSFNLADFTHAPNKVVTDVNSWVSKKTKTLIPELITRDFITSTTRLILTNAIYFKGQWEEAFDKKKTTNGEFHGVKGLSQVKMMHIKDYFNYYEDEAGQAIELPYKGGLSMVVTLGQPKDIKFSRHEVKVALPRFKMEQSFKLKPVLNKLGLGIIFTDEADFSEISDDPLKVSEVIHKAFVECDEQGTKAAAATAVGMMRCASVRYPNTKEFKADKPFMFYIKKGEIVLFQGRIQDLPDNN